MEKLSRSMLAATATSNVLQERMHVRAPSEHLVTQVPVVYFVFDLLYCDGYDLRARTVARTQTTSATSACTPSEQLSLLRSSAGTRKRAIRIGKSRMDLEGIVAKRIDSSYVSDRSSNWVKLKITSTVDAVVAAGPRLAPPALPLGSLLLGLYQRQEATLHRTRWQRLRRKETRRN